MRLARAKKLHAVAVNMVAEVGADAMQAVAVGTVIVAAVEVGKVVAEEAEAEGIAADGAETTRAMTGKPVSLLPGNLTTQLECGALNGGTLSFKLDRVDSPKGCVGLL